jgi:hypothetical protein
MKSLPMIQCRNARQIILRRVASAAPVDAISAPSQMPKAGTVAEFARLRLKRLTLPG